MAQSPISPNASGTPAPADATSEWSVIDPSGKVHVKKVGKRTYTHAVIRQNKGSDTYFVNWASNKDNAERESRALAHLRSYIAIVEL